MRETISRLAKTVAKRIRLKLLLLTVAVIFVYSQLHLREGQQQHSQPAAVNTEAERLSQPNQTLWKELAALPLNKLNLTSPAVPSQAQLLILVPLTAADEMRRQQIRASWAHGNHSEAVRSGLAVVIFVVGRNRYMREQLEEENAKFRDMLVVSGTEDTYRGLVYKLLVGFRWAAGNYPRLDVAKIDSDVVVELDRLLRAVNKQVHLERFILGYVWKKVATSRDPYDPWYIPASVYPLDAFPAYTNGPIYVISSTALRSLLPVAFRARVFEVEDAFFTGVVAEAAQVDRIHQAGIYMRRCTSQPCDGGGLKATVIAYPLHGMKLSMRLEYERMRTIPCRTWWQSVFDGEE